MEKEECVERSREEGKVEKERVIKKCEQGRKEGSENKKREQGETSLG